ncbi:MAG TPA: efflux RND transporter periplasmic adaptor subunit [Lacipirellulaceae bacterium]|nr:efflux RND transporter periplasmic adaptor subunit [Lacipirellulaceae bacterium]
MNTPKRRGPDSFCCRIAICRKSAGFSVAGLISCCAILFVFLAAIAGCGPANKFVPPPPPAVTVAHPIEKAVADTIEFVGTTEPTITVDLRARVNGYLEQVLFTDGSNVKAGDLLFVIEQAPYKIALDSAKAALQKAIASQALAESQYRRMAPLVPSGTVTQEDLDIQAAQVATSKADVATAEAAVKKAELDLGYTHITAPIDGRIGRHLVDVGNLVQAEVTPLATIQSINPIYAYFDVSENDLLRFMKMLRQNELPNPDIKPPELRLGLANEEGFPHIGHLDFRELGIDPQTGTARRRAIFPNPGWQLLPGMFVRLQASVGQPRPQVLVDERAIGTDQRGDYLLIVNAKNVVEYRPVKLGIHVDTMRVIEQGVTTNDWVIVNGLQRARPGGKVNPEQSTMSESAAGKSETGKKAAAAAKPTAPAKSQANKKESSNIGAKGAPAKPVPAKKPPTQAEPTSKEQAAPKNESPPRKSGEKAEEKREPATEKPAPPTQPPVNVQKK